MRFSFCPPAGETAGTGSMASPASAATTETVVVTNATCSSLWFSFSADLLLLPMPPSPPSPLLTASLSSLPSLPSLPSLFSLPSLLVVALSSPSSSALPAPFPSCPTSFAFDMAVSPSRGRRLVRLCVLDR
jgi:hypothetical protein